MYAQLGNIIFDKAFSPTSESDTLEISWVSHETINTPPKLQPTGRGAVEQELQIYMHQSFCGVEQRVKALTDYAVNYDVLPLLLGNGKLVGDFVITSIGKETAQRDELGNLIAVTVTLTLKEFIADRLQTEQTKANKKAFATGSKKGVVGKKKTAGPTPCKTQVSSYSSSLQSYRAKEYSDFVSHIQGFPTAKSRVIASVTAVKSASQNMANSYSHCLSQYGMQSNVAALITNCTSYATAMEGGDLNTKRSLHFTFQNLIGAIAKQATSANVSTITRKPA